MLWNPETANVGLEFCLNKNKTWNGLGPYIDFVDWGLESKAIFVQTV